MGFIAGAQYTEADLKRASSLSAGKSPAETLLAIYRVSPSMQRSVVLRHGAWCCCGSLTPMAPLAWWLTCFEYKSGLQNTLMVVTDRTVYRHIDERASLCLSQALKGTCATAVGAPTGSGSGKLPLARIESVGRSPMKLLMLDGAEAEPSTEWCCVSYEACSSIATVHPVVVGIKQQPGRHGGARTFTIFADSEEEADAAVELIKAGAKAARAGLPTLAEQAKARRSDTIRRHSDAAVEQMSMERNEYGAGGVDVPVGKPRRPRSISFEHLDSIESPDGYESATASSQAAVTSATSVSGASDAQQRQGEKESSSGAVGVQFQWFKGGNGTLHNEA